MPATSEALFQLLQMLTGLSEADAASFSKTANTRLLAAGELYIREGDTAHKVGKTLVRDKIDIVNRVHDKPLASLLGITPVLLSRIRQRR